MNKNVMGFKLPPKKDKFHMKSQSTELELNVHVHVQYNTKINGHAKHLGMSLIIHKGVLNSVLCIYNVHNVCKQPHPPHQNGC